MASPKPYASVSEDESVVQVLDSSEPLVTASSFLVPSLSSARVLDSIEPLVPTARVQVLDSTEPLVLSRSVSDASVVQEPVAGPSGVAVPSGIAGPSGAAVAGPSSSPRATASEDEDASDVRDPVAGPSGVAVSSGIATPRGVAVAGPSGSPRATASEDEDEEMQLAFAAAALRGRRTGSSGRRVHPYSEELRGMWNWTKVNAAFGTHNQCVQFAEERGLIAKQKICKYHKKLMTLTLESGQLGKFRCRKSNCRTKSVSRAIGTWFENARLSLMLIFRLMYAFSEGLTYYHTKKQLVNDGPVLSSRTVCDWYSYCRETIAIYELENQRAQGKIGGPNKVVQIDESKFGKRKYNRGRQIEGHWVIGMIEDGNDDLRLEVCPDNERSAEVLVPLIKKHVQEGSIVHTDFWRAYMSLPEHGYIHKRVNHSDPVNKFVAPDGTHTQRIESQWRGLKKQFRINQNKLNFTDWLCEYSWRRRIMINHLDPFEELITAIKYVYKIEL